MYVLILWAQNTQLYIDCITNSIAKDSGGQNV